MFLRTLSAALVGCTLLLAPFAAKAERGPSTPEERKQALEYIHHFEADPLNPQLKKEKEWLTIWMIEVPDIRVNICLLLDKQPKNDKKDAQAIFNGMLFAQIAFAIEHPEQQNDTLAQYQAGAEGALRTYEKLLKANPKDQQPYLDDLLQKREAGTLPQWVKERVAAACHP